MIGDFTAVPLRREDRWTGARMQQGRVLLDHEWNLNLDAAARTAEHAVRDVVGAAGVPEGSDAFLVSLATPPTTAPPDLVLQPGRMWVDGMEAYAPAVFRYSQQDQIGPLPSGRVLAYLDVFGEHVQPAEDPDALVDPALAPVDSATRTRIGYRVRVAATDATTCAAAFSAVEDAALRNLVGSTGRLTIGRTTTAATADPCDPPGDPFGVLPEGLLRVEVLDSGTGATARFAWSADNGAAAVAATFSGSTVTLAPSAAVAFANGDRVEVSWSARRADRAPHGPLYTVTNVSRSAAGDVLTLDRAVTAPAAAAGLVARRWDGEVVGATVAVAALVRGVDLGLRFTAGSGRYLAGDWWGARLRSGSVTGVETRTDVPPDGVRHALAPLALLDLTKPAVLADCRPTFRPLTGLRTGSGTCTVTVLPGDDIQAAVDSLPPGGGVVCIAAGDHVVRVPIRLEGRRRVVITGVGPATVVRSLGAEAVMLFERCDDVEVRRLRAVGGPGSAAGGSAAGGGGIDGALTFVQCTDVAVRECELACPDAEVRDQACVVARGDGKGTIDRIAITENRLEVGTWQTGVLVTDSAGTLVAGNVLRHLGGRASRRLAIERPDVLVRDLSRSILSSLGGELVAPAALVEAYRDHEAALSRTPRDRLNPLRAFVRSSLRPDAVAALPETVRVPLVALAASFAAAGQGIVVGGTRVGTVRIHDNLVEGCIQGIHVGTSHAREPGRERADEVVISRNVVHATVPATWSRERHAVFVGNARSVHITDTVATLSRPGSAASRPNDVEAVRVHGVLGPFLLVRQTSAQGFPTGVRVRAVAPVPSPKRRMWLVAETIADGGVVGVDAPGVAQANNVP